MAIDLKYGKIEFKKANNIGKDEPVFILRAKDELSVEAIESYISTYDSNVTGKGKSRFLCELYAALDTFEKWQAYNSTKLPD